MLIEFGMSVLFIKSSLTLLPKHTRKLIPTVKIPTVICTQSKITCTYISYGSNQADDSHPQLTASQREDCPCAFERFFCLRRLFLFFYFVEKSIFLPSKRRNLLLLRFQCRIIFIFGMKICYHNLFKYVFYIFLCNSVSPNTYFCRSITTSIYEK